MTTDISSSPFGLSGKSALITGAAGGIGRATAALFAAAGARLALSDRAHAKRDLQNMFPDAYVIEADLSDPEAPASLVAETMKQFGTLDILVCNAGIQGPYGSMTDAVDSAIDMLLTINLRAPLALCSAVAPTMAARGCGSIILTSSIAGLRGNKGIGLYGLTKAAVAQLARNLAVEWGPCRVRANAVSPGLIHTPFAQGMLENDIVMERRLSLTPLRRVGTPEEVAAAILFLASDAGGFVTGQNLVVDGGTTISDGN